VHNATLEYGGVSIHNLEGSDSARGSASIILLTKGAGDGDDQGLSQ